MPSWLEGTPFAVTVGVLFAIVLLRAQGTYWLGRLAAAGALRSRWADRVTGPRTTATIVRLHRWGWPLITLSFLTVGMQTVVNAAAGLTRMPWLRYTAAMVPGCLAWAVVYATVGFAALEAALALAARSPWALVAVLLLVAGGAAVLIRRRQRTATTPPGATAERAADPIQSP
ncbi:hypothetical protein FDO65_12025 [Nakamurella flava]|uniref:VTT domain-containing protein n=1 Tax=Nakamurella flava TaxID=2576308 RepID=A0A4U6QFB4_9ACTN|nr:hypothetical protein FDO65_12025 [Nakamurella flava]